MYSTDLIGCIPEGLAAVVCRDCCPDRGACEVEHGAVFCGAEFDYALSCDTCFEFIDGAINLAEDEEDDGPPQCPTCEDSGVVADPDGYDDIVSCPDCGPGPCPVCGGPGVALDTLGNLNHSRCRNCGTDYSEEVR